MISAYNYGELHYLGEGVHEGRSSTSATVIGKTADDTAFDELQDAI